MSTLEEKLEQSEATPGVRARAKLGQLMKRWKAETTNGLHLDTKKIPELVLVTGMRRETWKLVDLKEQLYELIEVRS